MKKALIKYGVTILIGALMIAGILAIQSFSFQDELQKVYLNLANAFTIVGVFILGVGLLTWVSTTGFFDGVSYVVKHAVKMLIPGYKKKDKKYYDYLQERKEKRIKGYGFILIVGILYFLVAVVFTILFYKVA